MIDRGNNGDWVPPDKTAFDAESNAIRRQPKPPQSKMDKFSNDIVPLAFAIGIAVFIMLFIVGIGIRVFIWAVGIW